MRNSVGFAFVLVTVLAACGSDGVGGGGGGDDTASPDASVTDPPPPTRGFQVISPDITIMAGQEITYCYYFHTPNTEPMVIKKWSSQMSAGSHHMIMFLTGSDVLPPGTVSATKCGIGGASAQNIPAWTYAAQTPTAELELPQDDGAGKPLGQEIPAGSSAYFQMHYVNATDQDMHVHVTLNAEAYDAGATYTKTAPYITFNPNISIDPGQVGDVEYQTCSTPANTKFWLMSTHSHKQSVKTQVFDGASMTSPVVFESSDWEHPGTKAWMAQPFYTFSSNKLTYACTYDNTGSNAQRTVTTGDSAQTDEMCMATGYYFPATKAQLCYGSFLVP